ncbi:MAG: SpvB/TcaC N-terminal domain-containing protein [Candidatus Electrothrix scaldis]|nr:MAG: SpvB/TcaC N-terminal domain-containing protein [Candidatus Electrothrix sp. GW3-3]
MPESKAPEGRSQEGESRQQQNPMSAPAIGLPKGGGAIKGMGEKFAANPVTGTGSMSVPLALSPGRGGFGPQLSLSYDSGAGNGPFGFGWSLSLPSITRKTEKGLPQYRDSGPDADVFILSGAEDLVPVPMPQPEEPREPDVFDEQSNGYLVDAFRPRIEGLFARIERWTKVVIGPTAENSEEPDEPGDVHWRSISKDNILTIYGPDSESRICDPADPGRVFSWLIAETRDDRGNAVIYEYKAEDSADVDLNQAHERNRDNDSRGTNRYLKRILYGNPKPLLDEKGKRPLFLTAHQRESDGWMFEAVFDYGEDDNGTWSCRPDPFSSYRAGFENRTYRLCQRVLMFHHIPDSLDGRKGYDGLVRSTDFTYRYETEAGKDSSANPIYTFLHSVTQTGYQPDGNSYIPKNLPPLEFEYSQPLVQDKVEDVDATSLENLPIGVDGATYQWTDLHGEGIPGILTEQAGAWFYKRNFSPVSDGAVDLAPLEQVAVKPNLSLASGAQFMDLAGDGLPDLAVLDGPAPGMYEHDEAEGWNNFRPFTSCLNRSSRDSNLKFVDLDGDGHADILITEDDALVWHQSLAEKGFGPARRVAQALDEEKGPRLIFADSTDSVYLADLSGDGLTDLVRIRNGEVCYWPNLGHCRFGAKVTMDNSPWFDHPDQFSQQRIRLADIDGSGTTDIIYLHAEGVRLYFNQSGNSWSKAQQLAVFPPTDNLSAVNVTDLLGNGTACLVWSSPLPGAAGRQMRYVNLMGGQKPHLLIKTVNNMGAETRVEYAPSTKFYLQDKLDNKPWISKLPFPVHVVEQVETFDRISGNRFVSSYAYHHGYFDGLEREFRGFGMVQQWDSEEFGVLPEEGQPAATNHDPAFALPPVLTRTWFHTGAWLDGERISRQFEKEYYRPPAQSAEEAQAWLLPDTILPQGVSTEEMREACRSLKGSMLRQEVYALDDSGKEEHPYTVTEQNFTIRLLQSKDGNRHAVFFSHPREAISLHCERNPDDPRIQHALTLEVDDFGNVLKQAAIGYGRKASPLTGEDKAKQEQLLITLTENDVTNSVDEADDYRAPLASEVRTFELTGLRQKNGKRFQLGDFITLPGQEPPPVLEEIAYQTAPDPAKPQKRLIERVRTLYRRNDLSGLLPLGRLESLALPGESYKLASTSELLAKVFQRDGQQLLTDPAAVLTGKGADQGGYVDLDNDDRWWIPAGRIFFSPEKMAPADELAEARCSFFTPRRHCDPFGNCTTVDFDHCLLPSRTADALGNEVKAENDYRVLQPWLMTDPNGNRTALAFDPLGLVVATAVMGKETSPGVWEGDSLEDPTARMEYELFVWKEHQKPNFVRTFSREQHGPDNLRWQESFLYSDGFGRELQTKVQAEPGEAPKRKPQNPATPYTPGVLEWNEADDEPIREHTDSRWVGTGRIVYNNKGKPIKQYEPFFSSTHLYEDEPEMTDTGVTPVLFYDPLGRVIATLHPNHTYEKVVFDPWRQVTYDVNDTCAPRNEQTGDPRTDADISGYVAEYFNTLPNDPAEPWRTWYEQRINRTVGTPEQVAAQKAAAHADTPTTAHFDSLGRTFLTIARNRVICPNHALDGSEEELATRVELDIEGNQRAVEDAKGRVVMRYDYDMLGTVIHQASMEAGERWLLNDVSGKPIRTWDSRGFSHRMEYDELRRPAAHYVSGNSQPEHQIEKTVYGETLSEPEKGNHRGKPYQVYDNAGVVISEAYDFKGNLLRSSRQLRQDYKEAADWRQNPALEQEIFRSRSCYDALNRPVQLVAPHSDRAGTKFDIIRPGYNEANLLERVDVWPQQSAEPDSLLDPASADLKAVTNIDYDAKGQRERIEYGNGAITRYEYDEETYRLLRMLTTRPAGGNGLAANIFSSPDTLQDLRYTYDPAGNITRIEDSALRTVFHGGSKVRPEARYTYDALYRLIEAEGREHLGQCALQPTGNGNCRDYPFAGHGPQPGDPQALRNYLERYVYDEVGNFLSFIHKAESGNWQRDYAYQEASLLEPGRQSNRLSRTVLHPNGSQPVIEPYSYDAHGNMTRMPHLPLMTWDFRDQLCASSRQAAVSGTPETTYYVYDSSGQRVRKVTESYAAAGGSPAKRQERIYLGGFEVYREWSGETCALERLSLHVMDDKQRIALVETKTVGQAENGDPLHSPLVRYQLSNHLGSASLELDRDGALISYEEYHPYGTTAFQLHSSEVSRKRYRYTGMERDEETGLNYHGARYYAGWLGRWCSCDPAGLVDGTNIYMYAGNSPLLFIDPAGQQSLQELENGPPEGGYSMFSPLYEGAPDDMALPIGEGRELPQPRSSVPSSKTTSRMSLNRPHAAGGEGEFGEMPTIGPVSDEQVERERELAARMIEVEYHAAHPTPYDNMVAEMEAIGEAICPAGPFWGSPGAVAAAIDSAAGMDVQDAIQGGSYVNMPLSVLPTPGSFDTAPLPELREQVGGAPVDFPAIRYQPATLRVIRAKQLSRAISGATGKPERSFTVAVGEPNQKEFVHTVDVNNPDAHNVLSSGKVRLLPWEFLGDVPDGSIHAEGLTPFTARRVAPNATGGRVGTSNYACAECGAQYYWDVFPGWQHDNPQLGSDYANTPPWSDCNFWGRGQ